MSKIAEMILNDGEVLSYSNYNSDKQFEFKILNSLDFETIKDFFIKKSIIDFVKQKHKLSDGNNGATKIELLNFFKWSDIDSYIEELEQKNIIKKKDGINLEMYFMCKK